MAFWNGYRWIRPASSPGEPRSSRLRDVLASIPMVLLVPALLVVAWMAQASTPSLAVQGVALRGSQLTVNGQAFARNLRVQLMWDGSSVSMPTARANQSGSFSVTLQVPTTASIGSHTIAAMTAKGSQSKRATVLASAVVSVVSGTPTPTPTLRSTPTPVPVTPSPSPTATPTPRPTASPTPTARPTPTPSPVGSGAISHVVIVWLENHEYGSVTSSSMPYLTGLGAQYGLATNFDAVTHPSLPNYLAVWSGSTQGVTDDGTYNLSANNLSKQMQDAGLSWRAFQQNYPSGAGCHTGSSYSGLVDGWGVSGTYARKHDPPMSFTLNGGANCADILPLAAYSGAANLIFVTPNLCNDAHDCSLGTADSFLRAFLPVVFADPNWAHTLLIVSFDEGTTNTGGGGHIYTMVARQGLSGVTSATPHNHYSVTRTVEDLFGLGCLLSSCSAVPLTEFLP